MTLHHISDEQAALITDGYKNASLEDKNAYLVATIMQNAAEGRERDIATLTAAGLPVPDIAQRDDGEPQNTFEAWMVSGNYPEIADVALEKLSDGNYKSQLTFAAWQAWQQAARQYRPSIAREDSLRAALFEIQTTRMRPTSFTGKDKVESEWEFICRLREMARHALAPFAEMFSSTPPNTAIRDAAAKSLVEEIQAVSLRLAWGSPLHVELGKLVSAASAVLQSHQNSRPVNFKPLLDARHDAVALLVKMTTERDSATLKPHHAGEE